LEQAPQNNGIFSIAKKNDLSSPIPNKENKKEQRNFLKIPVPLFLLSPN